MSFLNFFTASTEQEIAKYSKLHYALEKEYPKIGEKNLVIAACIAGLLARVAYVDFDLDPGELEQIKTSLTDWEFNKEIQSDIVAAIAIEHIKEMAGLENHLYAHPLREHLTQDERFKVLQSLFLVAASDGSVDGVESEEIRVIAKGLELSNQHFIVARAEVAKYLRALM